MTCYWSERHSCSGRISSRQNKPKTVKELGVNTAEQQPRLCRRYLQVWRLASEASSHPFFSQRTLIDQKMDQQDSGLDMPVIQPPFKVVVSKYIKKRQFSVLNPIDNKICSPWLWCGAIIWKHPYISSCLQPNPNKIRFSLLDWVHERNKNANFVRRTLCGGLRRVLPAF